MGRASLAAGILKDVDGVADNEGAYIIFYDWTTPPSNVFYLNLKILREARGDVERLQASVIQCRSLKTAAALYRLMKHYNLKVNIFSAQEVNMDELPGKDEDR
jgi:hypothetical protein